MHCAVVVLMDLYVGVVFKLRWLYGLSLVEVVLEPFESHHHYGQVVKGLLSRCVLHQGVHDFPADLVNGETSLRRVETVFVLTLLNSLPSLFLDLQV